jgi:Uma2 family endonuclease
MVTKAAHPGNGHGPNVPLLVVEFRTESTGRYVLGPKRMVYSRFRVPEFWYVDPMNRRVAILRAHEGGDYSWPPEERASGDTIEPLPFPGIEIAVDALLGPSFSDGSRARHSDGGESWLAS